MCVIFSFLIFASGCKIESDEPYVVTDVDGNTYNTVMIGEQVWMKENLKVTHYSDGTAIFYVTNAESWDALEISSKAYCWYDDNPANKESYGAMYTWAAAMNGSASSTTAPSHVQGACPVGWHIPSNKEWEILIDDLSDFGLGPGYSIYDVAKSMAAVTGWPNNNVSGSPGNNQAENNESGFTGVPCGFRTSAGSFGYYRSTAVWWSSTEDGQSNAKIWMLVSNHTNVYNEPESKKYGLYVRCVKDN